MEPDENFIDPNNAVKLPYLNNVVISGSVAVDPKLDKTARGHSVCKLRIRNTKRNAGKNPEHTFFDAVCWNEQADYVFNNMPKGTKVVITGRLKMDEWTDAGGQRSLQQLLSTHRSV
jgi:single-strand DNA-binding protein